MSLSDKFVNLASSIRAGSGLNQELSLDNMYMILAAHSFKALPGVNLINGSDPTTFVKDNIDEYTFAFASGGNGVGSLIDLGPSAFKAKHGFKISNQEYGSKDFNQRPVYYERGIYTMSIWARGEQGQQFYWRSWSTRQIERKDFAMHDDLWHRYSYTFDTTKWSDADLVKASYAFGAEKAPDSIEFAQPMLEVGDTAHDWQPSPYDKLGG